MEFRNSTDVIIAGKTYTLSGSESEDYLKKVASYLDHKLDECEETSAFVKHNSETKAVLLALNIADDYLKLKDQFVTLSHQSESKDREIYDLKHEVISSQIKLDNSEVLIDQLTDKNHELQEKISQLENEIKNRITK